MSLHINIKRQDCFAIGSALFTLPVFIAGTLGAIGLAAPAVMGGCAIGFRLVTLLNCVEDRMGFGHLTDIALIILGALALSGTLPPVTAGIAIAAVSGISVLQILAHFCVRSCEQSRPRPRPGS